MAVAPIRRHFGGWVVVSTVLFGAWGIGGRGLDQQREPSRRTFSVSARRYAFTPPRIEVSQGDLVEIAFRAEDIPHSFTVDDYRISKRANPGQTVTFEFLASRAGTFTFYCSLANDERCRETRGRLLVSPR